MGKTLVESKTFWVNALTLLIAIGGNASGIVPAEFQPYVLAGVAVANIALRLVTNQPIQGVV